MRLGLPRRSLAVVGVLAGACAKPPPRPAAVPKPAPTPTVVQAVYTEHPRPRAMELRTGRNLAVRSTGTENGEAWVLDENGYVGTFVELKKAGAVRVTVSAAGHSDQGVVPRMNVVVGALSWPFDVGPERGDLTCTMDLAPGTHFVRVELVNARPEAQLELEIASVGVEGAKLLSGSRDELALAAADTYIQNHRRGHARVSVAGAEPGTQVHVVLKRHAFDFGVMVPFSDNRLIPEKPADPESDAAKYRRMLLGRFNSITLASAGSWAHEEEQRDRVTPGNVDRFLRFAEQNALGARLHALLGASREEPPWVGSTDPKKPGLLLRAERGDARAKAELDGEIDERIGYAVKERAKRYAELDVIDESVHGARYYAVYGAAGIAAIFARTARAVREAGAHTRLFLNERDSLQFSRDPASAAPDPYANWYRRHAEAIVRAGGALDGLGIEYRADARGAAELGAQVHSPARAFGVLQNLSSTGLRLALTDFRVLGRGADAERAGTILEETLRLVFGTPQADGFTLATLWARVAEGESASALFDTNGEITVVGRRFDALLKTWSTDLELPVEADGTLSFDGFFGDYTLSFGTTTRELSLVPGKSKYAL